MPKRWIIITAAILMYLSSSSVSSAGTILFDTSHEERFLVERSGPLDLSTVGTIFSSQHLALKTLASPFTDEVLASADGVILSGPFAPVTAAESEALVRFVRRGGRLAIMLHIGTPLTELLHRLGVDVSNGVVHEQQDILEGNSVNFRVSHLRHHPLFAHVKQFSLFGGWALMNTSDSASIIATTGENAWIDLDGDRALSQRDAVQSFGVAVAGTLGKGEFVVFGDDAIFQNRFLDDNNHRLAVNLAAWFAEAASTPREVTQ